MHGVVQVVLMMALIGPFLGACETTSSREETHSAEKRVIYQPPVIDGQPGRIITLSNRDDREDLDCGKVSPVYHWVYERGAGGMEEVSTEIMERYPADSGTTPYPLGGPGRNANSPENFMDDSWNGLLDPYSQFPWPNFADKRYRKYSFLEMACWAAKGDQLANFSLWHFYDLLSGKIEEGFRGEKKSYVLEHYTVQAARARSMEYLLRSAAIPETVQACSSLGDECAADLTTPFPLGLPMANGLLYRLTREASPKISGVNHDAAEVYLDRAVRGGNGPTVYQYYGLQSPTH